MSKDIVLLLCGIFGSIISFVTAGVIFYRMYVVGLSDNPFMAVAWSILGVAWVLVAIAWAGFLRSV